MAIWRTSRSSRILLLLALALLCIATAHGLRRNGDEPSTEASNKTEGGESGEHGKEEEEGEEEEEFEFSNENPSTLARWVFWICLIGYILYLGRYLWAKRHNGVVKRQVHEVRTMSQVIIPTTELMWRTANILLMALLWSSAWKQGTDWAYFSWYGNPEVEKNFYDKNAGVLGKLCSFGESEPESPWWFEMLSFFVVSFPIFLPITFTCLHACPPWMWMIYVEILGHLFGFRIGHIFESIHSEVHFTDFYQHMGLQSYGMFAYFNTNNYDSWLRTAERASDPFGNPAQPLGVSSVQFTSQQAQQHALRSLKDSGTCTQSSFAPLTATCTMANITSQQSLMPLFWYKENAYVDELGIRFAWTVLFFAILTLFGLLQSIVDTSMVETSVEKGIETEEGADKYLEASREVRADMVCNAMGRVSGHMLNWIFVGFVAWCTPPTLLGQYGTSSAFVYWFALFAIYSILRYTIAYCHMWFYSLLTHEGIGEFFLKADKDMDGKIESADLQEHMKDTPESIKWVFKHLQGFGTCIGKFCLGFFIFNGIKCVAFQTFTSTLQTEQLLCKMGHTAFTPSYPEEYEKMANIFGETPVSPFGLAVCVTSLFSFALVFNQMSADKEAARTHHLAQLMNRSADDKKERDAVMHHHTNAMMSNWTVQNLEIPAIGVVVGLVFEEFFDTVVNCMLRYFQGDDACKEGNYKCKAERNFFGNLLSAIVYSIIIMIYYHVYYRTYPEMMPHGEGHGEEEENGDGPEEQLEPNGIPLEEKPQAAVPVTEESPTKAPPTMGNDAKLTNKDLSDMVARV